MIEVISNIHTLSKIKNDWDSLAKRFASPLLEFDWFITCIETIQKSSKLQIVIVREDNAIVAIAPLCITNKHGISTLEIIGTSTLYEPSGFLYKNKNTLAQLIEGIIKLKLPVTLLRFPDDPAVATILARLNKKKAVIISRQTAPSCYIDINSDWNDFFKNLSSNRRYDFKRKRKCLEKLGKVNVKIFNPELQDLNNYLQDAYIVENSGWKGRNKTSLVQNNNLSQFFTTYAKKACLNRSLRMCFIYVDDKPVSMHIAVESGNGFWVLKLGYEENLSKCSPGVQLALDTIHYAFDNKLKYYEFLGSEEAWQFSWPVKKHSYLTVLIFPYSVHALLGLCVFISSYFIRLLNNRLKKISRIKRNGI